MEHQPSANVERAVSRRIVNIEQEELDAWSALTQSGPVFDIGTVILTPDAWQLVPKLTVWMAIDLHQCGNFGHVCEETWARNERALNSKGSIVSFWQTAKKPDFWVVTDRCKSGITTTVSVMQQQAS